MSMRTSISTNLHRYLRIPYTLHTHKFRNPKKPRATYVLIHGIGNTLHSWDEVVAKMPKDVRIIGIDLLGFGDSPHPNWVTYSARTQARSVALTLLGMGLSQRPIIIGHSLGALVAVELAKRYPMLTQRLVLCSPPFYQPEADEEKLLGSPDDVLRRLYRTAKKYPDQLTQLTPLAVKMGLANKSLNVNKDNVTSYLAALESSIINQTSLQDIQKLKLKIDIFYGIFDPVVIKKHITQLAKERKNVTVYKIPARHEVVGTYVKFLALYLES